MEVRRGLLRALRNTGIIVIYQTPDLRVRWAQNIPEKWSSGDVSGRSDGEFMPALVAERALELKRSVLATGIQETMEFRDRNAVGARWYDMWIDADRDDENLIQGVVTTIVDVTERKNREQTLQTLLREVSHRSKNLLAIIQAIASQTGRYSSGIEMFLDRFRGRLQSLASSQDLVTSSNWRGAMLSELVEGQVDRFLNGSGTEVRFQGPDVYLNPNAALHIGLALHELVVNSLSHGALSRPNGDVVLTSEINQTAVDGTPSLVIQWRESTDARDMHSEPRFGSVALERVVPMSLDGRAKLEVGENRLDYRLEVPGGNFES
ncbi:sensor histidine kinase [Aquamicrobium zhengzhouense]|uniref:histidine kinase n=1 Tax=Aquamicrobium zhengzhouense TaxID=2781738 RepID=A0ABS0SDU1_9HYPH|nr:PAS domain-containing sensor histidine kinase [Aquamicrobium zhengzhouense]MBI1621421.1 PAS domain-containing protein [Aquamicrobium zhengzhouense]